MEAEELRCAVTDVGSNTIRLSAGRVTERGVETIFSKKITAGLAGYVRDGALTPEGIDTACDALTEIRGALDFLDVEASYAFATATIRNATNSDAALKKIKKRTGITLDLLSGVEEAIMGYRGVEREMTSQSGLLFDIGGGSTEVTAFSRGGELYARSFPLGSLNLYSRCVKRSFLPDKDDRRAMRDIIKSTFDAGGIGDFPKSKEIYAIGGSARAALLLAERAFGAAGGAIELSQLTELRDKLLKRDHEAATLILKNCPDRVHTVIPGLSILCALASRLGGKRVTVCKGGVREGYLMSKFLGKR